MVKLHAACAVGQDNSIRAIGHDGRLVNQVKHALRTSQRVLQFGHNVRNVIERLRVLVGVVQKDRQLAHRDAASNGDERAQYADGGVDQRIHKAGAGVRGRGEERRLDAALLQIEVDLIEAFLGAALIAERADKMLVADQFFDQTRHFGAGLALHLEHRIGVGGNEPRDENRQRRQRHNDQRNAPVDEQHDSQRAQNRQHAGEQLGKAHQQTVAELLHVGGNAADSIAGAVGIHIFERQNLQLAKRTDTHITHDLKGNAVIDDIHQPLGQRCAGNRGSHRYRNFAKACKINLTGSQDHIHGLAGQYRGQQSRDHCDQRKGQRQDDHAGIGADQLQDAMDRILVQLLLCLAHSVFATSSLLNWLRQISL